MGIFSLTYYLTQRVAVKFVKTFFGDKDIESFLQRLNRLTQDEARTTAAETLGVVYGLVQNMKEFMDGEETHFVIPRLSNTCLSRG